MTGEDFYWTDIDGDRGRLTTEELGTPGAYPAGFAPVAQMEIRDGENSSEHAVYIGPDDARAIIAWLEARL